MPPVFPTLRPALTAALSAKHLAAFWLGQVHTNMCVLGRPFGLRQLSRLGKNVALVRDLTDTSAPPSRPDDNLHAILHSSSGHTIGNNRGSILDRCRKANSVCPQCTILRSRLMSLTLKETS